MRTLKMSLMNVLALCGVLLMGGTVYGNTFAHLINTDGKVIQFNADTDSIISTTKLINVVRVQSEAQSVVSDHVNNMLYIAHGRLSPRVAIFDLKTLEFKKDLGLISGSPDVRIIAPPLKNNKFYVNWWDKQKKSRVFTSFDNVTLSKLADMSPIPHITEDIMYSNDKMKLYSINDGYPAKIDLYSTQNLALIKTIQLDSIFTKGIFGRGIDDYRNEKILAVENVQSAKDAPGNYNLYTYGIENGITTPKILTGLQGTAFLSPDATKIIFNEERDVLSADGSIDYVKSNGKLHVYDVASAKKVGIVQFFVDRESGVMGFHPNGQKLYMRGIIQGVKNLLVIDMINLKVTKTIKMPADVMFMIFYE